MSYVVVESGAVVASMGHAMTSLLRLEDIRIDGGTQSRVNINEATVAEYAEALEAGDSMPPVYVFFDGTDHWLADGFHRYFANQRIGAAHIYAEVCNGTCRDAKLYAYGANRSHGLRRSNDDKRNAVLGMLTLAGDWSDSRIAKHVGVDHKTVAAHRQSILGNSQDAPSRRTVVRNGKTYQQDTTGLTASATARKAAGQRAVESDATSTANETASTATAKQKAPGSVTMTEGDDDGLGDFDPLDEMKRMQVELDVAHRDLQRALSQVAELEAAMAKDDNKSAILELIRARDTAHRTRDDSMADAVAQARRAKRYEQQLARIGRAVGERDLDKVPQAVETLARRFRAVISAASARQTTPSPTPAGATPDREHI